MNTIILHSTPLEELREMIMEEIRNGLAAYFSRNQKAGGNLPTYWTRKEAAFQLKISLPTLAEWTKSGIIKSYVISGRVYYKPDELDKAMTERTVRVRK